MAGQFSEVGNFAANGASNVNPALVDILKQAADRTGMQVEAYSGYRPGDPRFHGKGMATDIRIIGPDGKPLPNYQTPETFQTYEQLAQAARQVQMEQYPELANQFRWGGYFGGPKGQYGSMDLMHFDLGGGNGLGMAGGSWENGLTNKQAALYQMANHKPQGLENLTVPADQRSTALALAGQNAASPAVGAVNALAKGVPANPVQTVNYVPPPFSGQQANFQPLLGDEQPAPQSAAPATPKASPAPSVAAPDPNADPLKAWGVDAGTPAPSQATPATPEQDVLKAWGIDQNANAPAAAVAAAPAQAPAIGLNDAIRSVGTGVPIIGGLLNKLNAGTNALVAPAVNPFLSKENQLQGGTFGERYQNSLAQQEGMDANYAKDHPIANTVGNVTGAVGGMIPAIAAAPWAMGAGAGGLAGNMLMGGISGATIGGADSAIRSGGDPEAIKQGLEVGGIFGGLGPAAGKLIGAAGNKLLNVFSGTNSAARNVAQVLSDIGMTPAQAKNALTKMGPNATLADLDPALTAEAGGLAAQGGAPTSILKNAMAQRAAGADDRVSQAVETTLGPRPDLTQAQEAISAKASADASPHYNSAGNAPLDPTNVLATINKRLETANGSEKAILTRFKGYLSDPTAADIGAQTKQVAGTNLNQITDYIANSGSTDTGLDAARAILVKAQSGTLDQAAAQEALSHLQASDPAAQKLISSAADALDQVSPLKTNPQALLKVRQAMDDDIQKAPMSDTTGGKNAERAANDIRGSLDSVLKQNIGIKNGDAAYYAQMQKARALDEGQQIFSPKTKIEDWNRSIAAKQPEEIQTMQTGALSSLWDALDNARNGDLTAIRGLLGKSTANRAKLEALFPNSEPIFDKISNEATMRATEQRVAQNSATAERQAVQQKYAPKQNGSAGTAEVLAGEALAGGPGAVAGYLGRNALNSVRNQISEGARSALTQGTASGLVATGPEQQQFLNKLARAAATSQASSAITNGANIGSNLLLRGVGDGYRNSLIRH